MLRRVFTSCLFLVGGLLMWVIIKALEGYGASQAGMSASSVSTSDSIETRIAVLLCSYFLVSALGTALTTKKTILWMLAACAHALVLIAFGILCFKASGGDKDKFLQGVLTLAGVTAVFFAPWLLVWGLVLSRSGENGSRNREGDPNTMKQ